MGIVLGKDIGHFVKDFIVSLQIYMGDSVNSVKQVAEDVFSVVFFSLSYVVTHSRGEKECCSLKVLRRNVT